MKEASWMKSKLRMPKGRANKNLDDYIDRIYKENKVLIDTTIDDLNKVTEGIRIGGGITDSKRWFKRTVKDLLDSHKNLTIKEAVNLIGRSTDFLSPSERSLQNIAKSIRKDENFKRFRKMIGYQEIDWNKLTYQGREDKATVFMYGNILIEAPDDSKYGHLNFYVV